MKWFTEGLNKEELTKAYKALAKKYHPDISKDPDATRIMQEINTEYDKYFVLAAYNTIGYNAYDMYTAYKKAKEQAREVRETILAFLRRDRGDFDDKKGDWFTFTKYGKAASDDGETWKGFHGGFSICRLTKKVENMGSYSTWGSGEIVTGQSLTRIPAEITCPTYADMYFAFINDGLNPSASSALITKQELKNADIDHYAIYKLVSTKYGDVWTSRDTVYYRDEYGFSRCRPQTMAYMKAKGMVLSCSFDLNPKFYKTKTVVTARDFGFLAFQDCTSEEFTSQHDVDFRHKYHNLAGCKLIPNKEDNFYWIENPMIAHFAREGVIEFYESAKNFRVRYGTFNYDELQKHLYEMSIDDAEEIQDFLDELVEDFETHVKGWVKRGQVRVIV